MGVSSHVSMTLWCELCSWVIFEGGRAMSPSCKSTLPSQPIPPSILLCITFRSAYMKHLFCWQLILILLYLTTHANSSVPNFKLGMQTNYPLVWMFFFTTLATAFPTSYHINAVCSCWVWKFSNDSCPLNLVPSVSFLTQGDWLEKKADQLLCIRKEKVDAH